MKLSPHTAPIRQTHRSTRTVSRSYGSTSSCLQLCRTYDCLTRSLRSNPITGPSALLRAGPPLCLAVLCPPRFLPLRALPLAARQHCPDRRFRGVQVLLFPASACDELTPPSHRAPPGQRAGCLLATAPPCGRGVVPGQPSGPGFDAITKRFDASSVVHSRSSSRRVPDPLIAGLFRSRFPPRLLTGMTLRWFGISACTANPEDLPPSLAQHGPCRRSSTPSPHSFQDTLRHECGS